MFQVYATINGTRTCCEDQQSVEMACIMEGISRFTQTNQSSLMHPSMLELFGCNAELLAAFEVLLGDFEFSQVPFPYLCRLLEHLYIPEKVWSQGIMYPGITIDEHIRVWRSQRTMTASTSTQLNFSDHQAAIQHPGMAKVDQLIREIPFSKGFAPEHGKDIEDFQILKKAGVWEVEKMRIIQMMGTSFNMNNKKMVVT